MVVAAAAPATPPGMALIPAGSFEMGDHHGFVDPELAWEYLNPVTRDGAVKTLGDVLPMTNSLFRAYRVPLDHPALKGRTLTPTGTITERAAAGLDPQPRSRPPNGRGKKKE